LRHLAGATDVGMVMESALRVRVEESAAAYRSLHEDWAQRLRQEAARIADLRPDLVLADVPYLDLAAALQAGVPALAMCSLHWGDIYRHYCGARPESARIHAQILEAYRAADGFLQLTPHMPMPDLPDTRGVGVVAELGAERGEQIRERLGLPPEHALVLIGLGGIATRLAIEAWPRVPGLHWLIPAAWSVQRADCHTLEALGDLPFVDILRSCDLLLTKPGYGALAEAACNGVRVAYLRREDWPEEPFLTRWIDGLGGRALRLEDLSGGSWPEPVLELLARPRPAPVPADGVARACQVLASYLPPA
jgi:hypothetical protein